MGYSVLIHPLSLSLSLCLFLSYLHSVTVSRSLSYSPPISIIFFLLSISRVCFHHEEFHRIAALCLSILPVFVLALSSSHSRVFCSSHICIPLPSLSRSLCHVFHLYPLSLFFLLFSLAGCAFIMKSFIALRFVQELGQTNQFFSTVSSLGSFFSLVGVLSAASLLDHVPLKGAMLGEHTFGSLGCFQRSASRLACDVFGDGVTSSFRLVSTFSHSVSSMVH